MIQLLFAVSAVLFYQVVETDKSERYFFNHKEILIFVQMAIEN